jgi:hypothetical protein
MPKGKSDRGKLKKDLVQRIGPWAFQSISKNNWHNAPDEVIIEGALLRARPEEKFDLLKVYSLDQILKVWQKESVIQDKWFHDANIWAAKNIFKVADPEKFVKQQALRSKKLRLENGFEVSL